MTTKYEKMKTQMIEILNKIEKIGKNEKAYPLIYNLKKLRETHRDLFNQLFLEMKDEKEKDDENDYFSIKRPNFLEDIRIQNKKDKWNKGWEEYKLEKLKK